MRANNTGRDEDIGVCQAFLDQISTEEHRHFVEQLITKSLKLGVDTKTVNKVYGKDFIPAHEIQQGSPRDKLRLKPNEVFWLTQKLNGIRGTYINGKMISRQGKIISGLEHIENELSELEKMSMTWSGMNCNFVFDGELIRRNTDKLDDNENFRIGTGIINSDDADKSCIEFVIFDLIPYEEFLKGQSSATYAERRLWLQVLMSHTKENVRVVPVSYRGADVSKIDEILEKANSLNWEGLMLNKDVPYYCKRHTGLVKIKTFKFSDLRVVGYEPGQGRLDGTLGALIVDFKGSHVNVGSGYTDEQRDDFWRRRDELVNSIIEVKYKEVSKDKKTGKESLQFPVFSRLRPDKNEISLE